MSDKRLLILSSPEVRMRAVAAIQSAPTGYVVKISPPTRSLEANARMWAMLTEVSRQVVWHGRKLDPDSWKCVFSAALKKQEVVPNLDGTGFVVLGQSTSQMSVREMSELQELIAAFGAERGVEFAEPVAA